MAVSNSQTYLEYVKGQFHKETKWSRSGDIETCIKRCARALAHGQDRHLLYIAIELGETLVPMLFESGAQEPWQLHGEMEGHRWWHFDALQEFVDHSRDFIKALHRNLNGKSTPISYSIGQITDIVRLAFESCAAVAETEQYIKSDLIGEGDVIGFSTKLGVHIQNPTHNFGDEVNAVTEELGALKSFYSGGTGSGKSTGASSQVWDYYVANYRSSMDVKVFDPIGMSVGENVNCYDVPQAQDDLRQRRKEWDLPVDITDDDIPTPKTDLYVPLTPSLREEEMPFDTENDEFVPTPFVIPASNFSDTLIVSMIEVYLSDSKERTIRNAYRAVDDRMNDWGFVDLADEIKGRQELSEKHIKEAVQALESLQSLGFIRTAACDHDHPDCEYTCRFVLDMDSIMSDNETVTRISQSKMDSEFGQLVVIAYLLDRVWELRRKNYGYPLLAVWLRELWEISPHGNSRRDYDDREEAVLEHIVVRLKKMLRKPRDIRTHLLADTQELNDIEKGVRRRFNRYVVFSSNDDTLQNIFNWVGKDGKDTFKRSLSDEAGLGGIIGGCEPAIGSSNVWGIAPVRFTPPPWHHHDKDTDGNGWRKRVELMSHREEFRHHDWPTEIPDRLEITTAFDSEEETTPDPKQIDRDTRIEIAQNLRNEGMTVREIADKVGRGRTWVSNHTEDPNAIV